MGQAQPKGAQLEDRYFVQKVKLGSGSFGTVWRAVDRSSGRIVAVKQLDKAGLPRRGVTRRDIDREISLMQVCSHENLLQLFDTFEDDKHIYVVLEYCEDGDFGDKLQERGMGINEAVAAEWTRQMCSGIRMLHMKRVCHRDIKPDNFLISNGTLKLSDFGLAMHLPKKQLLQEKCGTPAFMAPEQHALPSQSPGYGLPVDIWAAGVSLYMIMFGGKHPFLTERGTLDQKLLLGGALDFRNPETAYGGLFAFGGAGLRYSEEARNFCRRMVDPDPGRRPSAASLLAKHPWLQRNSGGYDGSAGDSTPVAVAAVHTPLPSPKAASTPKTNRKAIIAGGEDNVGRVTSTPTSRTRDAAHHRLEKARLEDRGVASAPLLSVPRTVPLAPVAGPLAPDDLRALEEEAAKLKVQNSNLRAELAQRKRKEEELELEARLLKEQMHLKQTTRPVPERALSMEVSPEVVHQQQNTTPKGVGNMMPGTFCRYESGTYGWMNAIIQDYNSSDCTYDLDVRRHAPLDKISPATDVTDVWPRGTPVFYLSTTVNQWLPALVVSFNEGDSTYNLDVRDHADVDRIRARIPGRPLRAPVTDSAVGGKVLKSVPPRSQQQPQATPGSTPSTSANSLPGGQALSEPNSPVASEDASVSVAPESAVAVSCRRRSCGRSLSAGLLPQATPERPACL